MGLLSIIRKHKLKSKILRVLILGLDNAGKTTITHRLLNKSLDKVNPTMGFNIETISHNGFTLDLWDIGGQKSLRTFWNNYFDQTDILIWVIDASSDRLGESWLELERLSNGEWVKGVSVLIWINKVDLLIDPEGTQSTSKVQQFNKDKLQQTRADVIEHLQLEKFKYNHWEVICCSAYNGMGIKEGLEWVLNAYKKDNDL
ncbi:Arf family GTPase [Martiniozyma asiatica (nom. inval.)]|nr:Arf family GTPase [Martiniozyma asiatica]